MAAHSPNRPIVVGYDGSPPSEAALQWAARAADHQKRPLTILHAAERITYTQDAGSGLWKSEDVLAEAKEVAQFGADKVADAFPDLEVETTSSLFSAKVALGEVSTHASMVVLGSHGRGRIGTLLLGSTAYTIAGYSRCPVVIVRDGESELPGPDLPVVVGTNATGGSQRAVETAIDVARDWGSPLVLATTWAPAPADPWDRGPAGYSSAAEASADYEAKAHEANAQMLADVGEHQPDLKVGGKVLEGHPVDALSRAGEEGGLLVLGTRGHGTMAGSILGATSLGVLHQASAPIMIVD
ncbi:MAG TPA: universal stress protein [Ornithinimicrobium sp.]|uniref:universal stress protein n=1 Tax=Ornithinimicrobium sp. TaxID=1977084 RepID=UPI002B46DF81|nr:universal stress protein [Ornithinimicrobium sp.]HKJ11394.1 universal stress protein [Ornithinimicrobium sp.]